MFCGTAPVDHSGSIYSSSVLGSRSVSPHGRCPMWRYGFTRVTQWPNATLSQVCLSSLFFKFNQGTESTLQSLGDSAEIYYSRYLNNYPPRQRRKTSISSLDREAQQGWRGKTYISAWKGEGISLEVKLHSEVNMFDLWADAELTSRVSKYRHNFWLFEWLLTLIFFPRWIV